MLLNGKGATGSSGAPRAAWLRRTEGPGNMEHGSLAGEVSRQQGGGWRRGAAPHQSPSGLGSPLGRVS